MERPILFEWRHFDLISITHILLPQVFFNCDQGISGDTSHYDLYDPS
jgi:hypothetical protein